STASRHLLRKCSRTGIRLRVALCYIEIALRVRTYPRRLRSGGGQTTKPGRSARSTLSHRSGVFNRSRRAHPEHLQFGYARPAPRSCRCEDSLAGNSAGFETIIVAALPCRRAEIG